jgi:hypothetical protein
LFSAPVASVAGSRANGAQDAPMGASPQDSPTTTAGGDRIPAPDTTTVTGAAVSVAMSEAAAGGLAASTGLASGAPSSPPRMAAATASTGANNNAVEEPEVILGHPSLRALGGFLPLQGVGHDPFCAELGARCATSGVGGYQ